MTVAPHSSVGSAVKTTSRHTVAPPATSTPKLTGPGGFTTPPVAASVATRSVVSALPVFWRQRLAVTVSPGSRTPLGG